MKIQHDYHMHTSRCGHASGTIEEYVAEAKRKGLAEIGMSDHLPFVTHRDPQYTMDLSELPEYHRDMEAARARHAASLSIKIGIEADYMQNASDKIGELLKKYPYDFVIGSVHFMKQPEGDWAFDDPREIERWQKADVDEVYRNYYRLLQGAARSGLYDIMGHVDLVKKFGHRPKTDLTELVRQTARVFGETGVAIEINTSGLRKPVKEIYPTLDVLKSYAAERVPIVFGSDAHDPKDVGADFDRARELALAAGYTEYLVFKQRKVEKRAKL